jgi:uncharacterized protein YdeI (YjbR/CyaY-like superfamily)
MEIHNGIECFYPASENAWRRWLEKHHAAKKSLWVIIYKKETGVASITYEQAIEQALCFGWVDSKGNKRDDQSFYLFFAKRNSKSKWSKPNRERVGKLISKGLMTPSGLEMVALAKKTGTWDALDQVEKEIIPPDLQAAFDKNKPAFKNFMAFPPSSKKIILGWILDAKRPATRENRVAETISLAAKNIRAHHNQQ